MDIVSKKTVLGLVRITWKDTCYLYVDYLTKHDSIEYYKFQGTTNYYYEVLTWYIQYP